MLGQYSTAACSLGLWRILAGGRWAETSLAATGNPEAREPPPSAARNPSLVSRKAVADAHAGGSPAGPRQ